jgi:hypothetical protein
MNILKGILFFIGLFVLSRLVPHPPNFTPIIAAIIFLPFISNSKLGMALPIAVMLVSDLIIGFHGQMFWVYGSFLLISLSSYIFYLPKFSRVLTLSILSPTLFYLITNFGVWMGSPMYDQSLTGLFTSYVFALPFFANSLMSSILFVSSFFLIFKIYINQDLLTNKA